jgi:flagellin
MREVSVQAANDTNNSQDRGNLKAEMDSLSFEINRIASTTTWAGTKLMEDEAGKSFSFQVGAATGDKNQILVNIGSMNTASLGVVAQSSGIGATNTSDFVINTDFNYQHHEGYGTYTDIVFKDTDDGQDTFIEIKGVTFTATFAETGGNAKAKVQTIYQKLGEYGANIDSSFTNFGYSGDEQVGNTYALNVFIGNESSVINNYITDGGIYSGTGLSMESATTARSTISAIDAAIQTVNIQRSELGAVSNRLNHTVNNLTNISSNLSAAKGGIEDADFALETTNLAKNQILQQASTAMLAQANASKQNVLSLLQG